MSRPARRSTHSPSGALWVGLVLVAIVIYGAVMLDVFGGAQ